MGRMLIPTGLQLDLLLSEVPNLDRIVGESAPAKLGGLDLFFFSGVELPPLIMKNNRKHYIKKNGWNVQTWII